MGLIKKIVSLSLKINLLNELYSNRYNFSISEFNKKIDKLYNYKFTNNQLLEYIQFLKEDVSSIYSKIEKLIERIETMKHQKSIGIFNDVNNEIKKSEEILENLKKKIINMDPNQKHNINQRINKYRENIIYKLKSSSNSNTNYSGFYKNWEKRRKRTVSNSRLYKIYKKLFGNLNPEVVLSLFYLLSIITVVAIQVYKHNKNKCNKIKDIEKKYECFISAIEKRISIYKSGLSDCIYTENPTKCKNKINRLIDVQNKKLELYKMKLKEYRKLKKKVKK